MMILLSVAFGLLAAILVLPTLSDLVSLLRVWVRGRAPLPASATQLPRFLLLVPAHDEALLLPACVASLRRLRYPPELLHIVVIADNCHDRTAEVARSAGARCLVRTAPNAPGKPRAVAWALSRLPVSAMDGIVIVDADTEVDQDFAIRLATAAPIADKALQPYNDVGNRSDNALTRMASVLSAANHGLAYVLKTRAGLNVPLSVGMCIGSGVLAAHGWTAFSLSEDWELYALLTARGVEIQGVPGARIYAQEAATLATSASQRRRWTAGKLTVLLQHAWPLLCSRQTGAAQKLDCIAELSVAGPVVHLCIVAVATTLTQLLHPPASAWLATALLATLVRPVVYTVAALGTDPEPGRAIRAFAFLPVYAVWRLGIALTALGLLGDKRWTRTARHARSAEQAP
jgi:cellulose synthase/poly-beta-1,6-N-acetylglucosamine synthase-like glycosyltransferase